MYSIARYVARTQIKQIASYCLSIDDLVGPPNSKTVRWNRREHQEWTIQRHSQQLSHRKQDEDKEINKNAEHKTMQKTKKMDNTDRGWTSVLM